MNYENLDLSDKDLGRGHRDGSSVAPSFISDRATTETELVEASLEIRPLQGSVLHFQWPTMYLVKAGNCHTGLYPYTSYKTSHHVLEILLL